MDSGDLMVWIRGPDGAFRPKKPAVRNRTPTGTVVGDFTGDGRADILVRDADGTPKLRTGRGDATFDDPRTAPVRR
ncbi:FG-GAP repeat domain-containing protein [Streptomyces bikiniensis]|uniref:FG-GAP repeat domain-containing protein n=1 Tax=Streptomyces bikiniensis TaxID=1896 RepID=A0ABW8CM44_STRBI